MRNAVNVSAVVALLAIGGLVAWKTGAVGRLMDSSHGAIATCEATLLKQLRSPSSYKRISAEYVPAGALSLADYAAYLRTQGCPGSEFGTDICSDTNEFTIAYAAGRDYEKGDFEKLVRKPTKKAKADYIKFLHQRYLKWPAEQQETAFVNISHDAANAYGTPIRSTHICRFGPRGSGDYQANDMFMPVADAAE